MRQFIQRVNAAHKNAAQGTSQKGAPPVQEQLPRAPMPIYSDCDVCRIMGLRRRVLVAARTKKTRGIDWDVVGHQAGMTAAWITKTQPSIAAGLKAIKTVSPENNVWTLTVQSQTRNRQVLLVRDTDGNPDLAHVPDGTLFHPGDQFNAVPENAGIGLRRLVWTSRVNPEKY